MLKPKTLLFLLLGLMMLAPPGRLRAQDAEEEGDEPPVPRATIALAHVSAVVRLYEPDETPPKAIFIFGSGDGGWSPWEDVVARWLRDAGAYVVGFDLHDYSEKDYTQNLLGTDMATLAADAATRCNGSEVPVIYGGWSMGAVQAVAAAASKTRPPHLAGLILMSADDRGRYGLRKSDELGITPEGPGTFGLADFSGAVKDLRVAQFHGSADFMASMTWIQTLKSPHALYVVPRANHGFDGPDDSFQEWIQRGLNWVLGDEQAAAPPPHRELPFGLSPLWPAALVSVLLTGFFLISKKH
ncbi:MAG: AcvB/VirJ family lysyl-phosphatidylglycerol hydrolase, partial [Verrucomicrobiales bacterium]